MSKANVFIVGLMKSGTTAVAQFLSEHPEVCVSIPKEPGTFASDKMKESDDFHGKKVYFKVRSEKEYKHLFSHAENYNQYFIDASTAYIYSREAAKNIHEYNPEAKIIIMLREPTEFLYSLHNQYLLETVEDVDDFGKALKLERERKKGNYIPPRVRVPSYLYYSERVRYSEQIKRYLNVFDKKNVLIILHDDFVADNARVYKKILDFMGANTAFEPDFKTVLGRSAPRLGRVHRFVNNPTFKNTLHKIFGIKLYTWFLKKIYFPLMVTSAKKSKIDPKLKQQLMKQFKPEIESLSALLDIDLVEKWGYSDI